MKVTKVDLSVVIPTYNSSNFIEDTLVDVISSLKDIRYSWELILIDDSSTDDTYKVSSSFLKKQNLNFKIIQLMKNSGQNTALFTGIEEANGDLVLTMDDDMEVPGAEIVKIVDELNSRPAVDVLIGISKNDNRGYVRKYGTKFHNYINKVFFNVEFQASGFRIIRRTIIDAVLSHTTMQPHLGFLLIKTTKKIENFYVNKKSAVRDSNYSLFKLIKLVIWNTINYTSLPLDLVSNIGILTSSISTLYGFFVLIQYATGYPYEITNPGWTSLITSMFFLSGLILLSLGIIGKYIMRVVSELTQSKISQKRNVLTGSANKSDENVDLAS